jgi:hypothetical protein
VWKGRGTYWATHPSPRPTPSTTQNTHATKTTEQKPFGLLALEAIVDGLQRNLDDLLAPRGPAGTLAAGGFIAGDGPEEHEGAAGGGAAGSTGSSTSSNDGGSIVAVLSAQPPPPQQQHIEIRPASR